MRQASDDAAEPSAGAMTAPLWPPVDRYRDEPDEISRWERIDGIKKEALPATADHGDPHFKLDSLLDAHLAEGYVGSVDLKTRVDPLHEYASDTCVRRKGIDPETGRRYLEELVFEIVHKRSRRETNARARGFAARGVRRQIGIFVREKEVREWRVMKGDWSAPLDLETCLQDPCLAVDLPLAAFFDRTAAQEAISRALEAKSDPTIVEMKHQSEKRGEERGERRGRARSVLSVLEARGFEIPQEFCERVLATTDGETLERWLRRAATASSPNDIFGRG